MTSKIITFGRYQLGYQRLNNQLHYEHRRKTVKNKVLILTLYSIAKNVSI